jgi:carbon storage regulator
MLILSRKINESIVIDGRITVKIVRIDRDVVKLGIVAPADVPVHREEVYEEIRKNNQEAITQALESVPRLSAGSAEPKKLTPLIGGQPAPESSKKPKPD